MINFRKARFVVSSPDWSKRPNDGLPSLLFVGRSNVGKSTLINALTGQKLAFSSKKAGKTKLLNYFLIDDSFYLVDSPGYGSTLYANLSTINFAKMMEDYVKDPSLKGIVFLLDLRHDLGKDDLAFVDYLKHSGVPITAILTKMDTMNQKEKSEAIKRAEKLGLGNYTPSDNGPRTLDNVRKAIAKALD